MEGEQGEAIMICIDTGRWMMGNNSHMFKQQADAIRLYCTKKFKSHEDTVVGICGMGEKCIYHLAQPDRILSLIMNSLDEAVMGGDLMFVKAVMKAHTVWFGCWDKELGNHLPKRIAVLAGGPVYEEMGEVQILGKAMKDRNVACDVISFGDPAINKQQLFKTLIDAADNNGNCNLLHVPPNFTVHDFLLRSQIIQSSSAPFASLPVQPESSKQDINALSRSQIIRSGSTPFASLSLQQESSKQNIKAAAALYSVADNTDALSLSRSRVIPHVGGSGPLASLVHQESSKPDKKAAANYPESVDPHDQPAKINALSQSVVDLKLDNVKPNSQPETLDQRIERVKRELESLIMQKNKQKNKKKKKNKQKNKQVAC